MSSKPFKFFPHERPSQPSQPIVERKLESFFADDEPRPREEVAIEANFAPEEDLREGLDFIGDGAKPGESEDAMIAELVRNHPNNLSKKKTPSR
jgi:hypothetical protein